MTVEFPVIVELEIDGVWRDVESIPLPNGATRLKGKSSPPAITRGRSDESSRVSPSECTVLLGNDDGLLSEDNPASVWWPHVRRGMGVRISVVDGDTTHIRMTGRATELRPVWDQPIQLDDETTPPVMRMQITVAGVLRRLEQGNRSQGSTLRRYYNEFLDRENLRAYWPMEDGDDSQRAASPVPGVEPMLVTMNMSTDDTLPASEALPNIGGSEGWGFNGSVPKYPAGTWEVTWVCRLPALAPAKRIMQILLAGASPYVRFDVVVSATQVELHGINSDGAATVFTAANTGFFDTTGSEWVHVRAGYEQGSTTAFGHVRWYRDGVLQGTTVTNLIASGSVGRVSRVQHVTPIGPSDGYSMGHVAVVSPRLTELLPVNMGGPVTGFAGEAAGARFLRLCEENAITATVVGDAVDTAMMGPQRPLGLLDLLAEVEAADGGIGPYEPPDVDGLAYRTRASLFNQTPTLTLDMAAGGVRVPFEPISDDKDIRNDVTVSRPGGSEARATLETGEMSTQDPPDGVGPYDESLEANVQSDDQLPDRANWRLLLGTWPGPRHRNVSSNLRRAGQGVRDAWVGADLGDLIRVENLPRQHQRTVDLLLQGSTETLPVRGWDLAANTSPAGPYQVGVLGATVLDGSGSGPYATTPDPHTFSGDLDIRVHVAGDDWTPGNPFGNQMVTQWGASGNQAFLFGVNTAGNLTFGFTTNGSTLQNRTSTAPTGFTDGTDHWVRATLDVNNGAAGHDVTFYTSEDGATWIQLGNVVTTAGTVTIFNSTAVLAVGDIAAGGTPFGGLYRKVEVYDGIGGTLVADPDFAVVDAGAASFTDSSGNTWSMTASIVYDTPVNGMHRLAADPTTIAAALNETATGFTARADGVAWINSTDHAPEFPLRIIVGGEEMDATAITAPVDATVTDVAHITDTFTRSVSDDWGSADSGQPWGFAGDLGNTTVSVDGTRGLMTLTADPNQFRVQAIGDIVTDAEVLVSISPNQVATGAGFLPGALFRFQDVFGIFYRARAELNTDGSIDLAITRGSSVIGTDVNTGLTYIANDILWLRAQCQGHTVRARLWKDGDPEPGTWTIERTVTAAVGLLEDGQIGVSASTFGGNTNVNPTYAYDNFSAATISAVVEQDFTVTRSVNHVVKSHPAGATVAVARPLRLI